MDKELLALAYPEAPLEPGESRELETKLQIRDESPEIEVHLKDEKRRYTLKPLTDLYDRGTGLTSVDLKTPEFVPLYLSIEEEVLRYNTQVAPDLTDGAVLLIVKQLGMDPDHEPTDRLGKRILALRLNLSVNNYSRQDVKAGLRQIAKSIERHTHSAGIRGYLRFLRTFFKQ